MMYGWGYGEGYGIVGFIFMVFIMTVIVIGIIWGIRLLAHSDTAGHEHETVLNILKKRYASGDISKEEYDRMKKDVQQTTRYD